MTPKLEAHLLKQGGDSGAKVWKMCEMVYSKLQYKVKSKAVIDGLHLHELSFKEIQNSLSFVGFGEITLGGVERGTVRGMVEGGI